MTDWRRAGARAVAVAVLTAGAVPLASGTAWACSCGVVRPDPARYAAFGESEVWRAAGARAGLAYVGEVVSETLVDPDPRVGGEESYAYEVTVVQPLEGAPSGTRTLTTPASGAACGLRLRPGRVLVVDDVVGLCGPTTQERVDERAQHVRTAAERLPTTRVVAPGETLRSIARTEAAVQSGALEEPGERAVTQVVRRLRLSNPALRTTTVLRPGQRLAVPAL